MIQECTRCLYTSAHPLNIIFDENGLCSGCLVHEEKEIIDWSKKGIKLKKILETYKNKSGNNYDCIIPVSGARDSYFIVHTIKNVYGMNPLLVTYNKQYNTDLGIRNLANLRIKLNCDIINLTVNPQVVKKITKATIKKTGSIYWHCIAGQTVFPVQIAVKFKIPLIIWGAHQGIDQVGMFSHNDEVEMTRKYRKEHDLMGIEAEDLINRVDNININDVRPFCYPDEKEIEQIGVKGIYLNNYMRWDTKAQHEKMLELYDYETGIQTRTFDLYNDVDCFNYSDVHDYIKFIKHGYGKVTDNACREIRFNRLSKQEALQLKEAYENKYPKNINQFLDWIGIKENAFNFLIDQFRNKIFWKRNSKWQWEKTNEKRKINLNEENVNIDNSKCNFILSSKKPTDLSDDKYILIGKGV
jgi:N-acetyl sugar amidotransferase